MAQVTAQGHLPVRRAAQAGQDATYYQIVTTKDTFLDSDTAFQVTFRVIEGTTITKVLYSDLQGGDLLLSFAADIDSKTTITSINPNGVITGLDLTNATMINLTLTDLRSKQVVAERHLGVYHGGEQGQPGEAAETFSLNVTPLVVAFDPREDDKVTSGNINIAVIHGVGSEQTILTQEEMTKYNCRVGLRLDSDENNDVYDNIADYGLTITPHHVQAKSKEMARGADVYAYMGFSLYLYVNDKERGSVRISMLGDGKDVYTYASTFCVSVSKFESTITTLKNNEESLQSSISQTSSEIYAYVQGNSGTGGIDIQENKVTLIGDRVYIKGSNGEDTATFSMLNGQGMLNVDIIDTDRLAASQILCKNPSNEDSEISLYAPYMAKINSEGNGEYIIYHPRLAWGTSGHSMGSKVVPALRMAVEDVYIFTGDTAPTKYTALIQAFNETGALISALTTKGWVVPVSTAVSFVEIAIAVDSSGNPITTETAAAKTTLFSSSADLASTMTHYYRIQVDTSFGTYSDYNNCMTTDTSKNTFTSNLVKGKTYYSPSYQTRKGFVPANSDSGTDFDTSKDIYCRKSYKMDSNGVISIDTIYWQ